MIHCAAAQVMTRCYVHPTAKVVSHWFCGNCAVILIRHHQLPLISTTTSLCALKLVLVLASYVKMC